MLRLRKPVAKGSLPYSKTWPFMRWKAVNWSVIGCFLEKRGYAIRLIALLFMPVGYERKTNTGFFYILADSFLLPYKFFMMLFNVTMSH